MMQIIRNNKENRIKQELMKMLNIPFERNSFPKSNENNHTDSMKVEEPVEIDEKSDCTSPLLSKEEQSNCSSPLLDKCLNSSK
eukprot:UN07586